MIFHMPQRWRRTERMLERSLRNRRHEFFSDACRHGLHAECPRRCEFCQASCLCRCHRAAP